MKFKYVVFLSSIYSCCVWAGPPTSNSQTGYSTSNTNQSQSSSAPVSPAVGYPEEKLPRNATESQVLSEYIGIAGTGVANQTVSVAGGAFELTPGGVNLYGYFTQTLSNRIYYEARLYSRYNYTVQSPIFPNIPPFSENNSVGYGFQFNIGYDFRPTRTMNIVPYLRLFNFYNANLPYANNLGNSINTVTYAITPGVKVAYAVTPDFNPYINIYVGWAEDNLNGNFTQSTTPGSSTGVVDSIVANYEIGFSSRISNSLTLVPYIQLITLSNYPNNTAAAPYAQNGFNVTQLTTTQQIFGLRLSYAW